MPLVLGYLAVGTAVGLLRSWSLDESVYFTVATLTTVGYGDFSFNALGPGGLVAGAVLVAKFGVELFLLAVQ